MKGATLHNKVIHLDELVSIHAPNEGSDSSACSSMPDIFLFQSTLPMKGATQPPCIWSVGYNVSIHAPNEGSDGQGLQPYKYSSVSIHAPNEGSDSFVNPPWVAALVSIHAPNEGSDLSIARMEASFKMFQSTLPMKGATICRRRDQRHCRRFNPRSQ